MKDVGGKKDPTDSDQEALLGRHMENQIGGSIIMKEGCINCRDERKKEKGREREGATQPGC